MGKADADREAKGIRTCQEPGVRPMACKDRNIEVEPETPVFPQGRLPHRYIRSSQEGEPDNSFLPVSDGDGSLRPSATQNNRGREEMTLRLRSAAYKPDDTGKRR